MPVSVFGATAALLQSDYFPHYTFGATSHPTSTAVGTVLTRVGAIVSGRVQGLGLDPSAIDNTGEPIAYQFCQDLVLAGAAYRVGLAFTGRGMPGDVVDTWRRAFRDGLKDLSDARTARVVLVDAYGAATAGRIRTHVQEASTRPTATSDIEIDDPEFVRDMDL